MSTLPGLATLLARHGLAHARETPLTHTGFSGAMLTRLVRDDGASFVLKRMSIERDWIMRATNDVACREVGFAVADVALGGGVQTPAVGGAGEGGEYALLMADITDDLLPRGMIGEATLDIVIERMASLHRVAAPASFPGCDLGLRLSLLTPNTAHVAKAYGAPVAADILEGWRLFERHATPGAVALTQRLFANSGPFVRALEDLPPSLLHGDLKLDNIGLDAGGRMWLVDWAMTLAAPAAVDLGWFLAINSRRVPRSLDEIMRQYAEAASIPRALHERHDALAVLCGLLLRGWRKALDAEQGEPEELWWWCERAEAAGVFLDD